MLLLAAILGNPNTAIAEPAPQIKEVEQPRELRTMTATVTAFNSLEAQTDSTPCVAAGGWICGRLDVAACPRNIPLYSWIEIDGKKYECLDRLHPRYDHRFDLFFDKDLTAAINWGRQTKTVTLL